MHQLDLALAVAAAIVLLVGIASRLLKRSPLQESIVALGVGVLVGPYALGLVDVADRGSVPQVPAAACAGRRWSRRCGPACARR